MYALTRLLGRSPNPILANRLFKQLIVPISLHAVESWLPYTHPRKVKQSSATEAFTSQTCKLECDKLYNKFIRILYGLSSRSSDTKMKGEMGQYPVYIDAVTRVHGYMTHVTSRQAPELVKIATRVQKQLATKVVHCWWNNACSLIKTLPVNPERLSKSQKYRVREVLEKEYRIHWNQRLWEAGEEGRPFRSYRRYKQVFQTEGYLTDLKGYTCINVLKFRLGDYKHVDDSSCPFCGNTTTPDPVHLTQCNHFQDAQLQHNVPTLPSEIHKALEEAPNNMVDYICVVTKAIYLATKNKFKPKPKNPLKVNPLIT